MHRLSPSAVIGAIGLVICACTDPMGAPATPAGSLAQASAAQTGNGVTLVLFPSAGALPAGFWTQVSAAGGDSIFALPDIGVAVVRLSAGDVAELATPYGAVTAADDWLALPAAMPAASPPPAAADPTTEPFFAQQWGIRLIGADRAIAAGHTGAGARIAIIDSGIYYPHPDLAPNYAGGRNFFAPFCASDPQSLPSTCDPDDPIDDSGHGTHVAGIAAAALNGFGVLGVAPEAELLAVRACARTFAMGCPAAAVIAGIVYATNAGADVINLSVNCVTTITCPEGEGLVTALRRATNYAHSRGTLVVTVAQNNGLDLQKLRGTAMLAIGSANNALVTSAVGADAEPATFLQQVYSNHGNEVDLAAPGGSFPVSGVLSTWSPLSPPDAPASVLPGGLFAVSGGTSMAAPHVAGAAAQITGQLGARNPSYVRTRLQQTATDLGKSGRDPFYGHGLLNVWDALR